LRGLLLREGRGGKRGGDERGREGRGSLSGNLAEEAFCLKSAPVYRGGCPPIACYTNGGKEYPNLLGMTQPSAERNTVLLGMKWKVNHNLNLVPVSNPNIM